MLSFWRYETIMHPLALLSASLMAISHVRATTVNHPQTDSVGLTLFKENLWGNDRRKMTTQLTLSQYDDLGPSNSPGNPPALVSDGGVAYNHWNYVTRPSLTGIKPVSGSNVAVLRLPAQGSVATTERCVVLKELYFGCTSVNVQPALNVPLSCSLSLTAYGKDNNRVGLQTATFTPNNPTLSSMSKATISLPPADVVFFSYSILDTSTTNMVTAALVDNFTYVQYDDAGAGNCGTGF